MKILGFDISINKEKVTAKTDTKSKGYTNPAIIKIAQGFKDTSRKDIQKWRTALQQMQHPEEPKFAAYYDLINDLLTDGHLQSQMQMRKMSTLNTDFQVINRKTGKINEALSFTVQQQWFYQFLDTALDSVLFGASIVEFTGFNGDKISLNDLPRRNVVTTQKRIYPDLQKPDFIDYSNPLFAKWLLQIGHDGDIGILNNIIPNLIWLRNVMQSWAEFCEKFGLPLITATTNTTDSGIIKNVHEMLINLGEAGVGTFPHGTEISFQEANRTDAYQTYMQFIKVNADMVSKQLVGSTMLADQGSNRSQTEVHERTLDNKIAQSDKRLIQFIVNDQLFPLLQLQGYAISEDDIFEFKTAEQDISLTELWNITNGLLTSGHEVQTEWLSKTFNIPIEGKKKSLKLNDDNIKAMAERYPANCCATDITASGGAIGKTLNELTLELINHIFNKKDTAGIIGQFIVSEGLHLLNGLRKNFKTISPYMGPDLLMLQMMEYNIFEFSASKTEARLVAMTDLLIDKENKKLREFKEFEALCLKETKDFDKRFLRVEYDLAVSVGQNSAAYVRFMAEKDSVTSFVKYQTVGDAQVRASHQVLDGKIFNLSDKEAMDLFPPNGYGCRCEMLQHIGPKTKVMRGAEAKELLLLNDPKYIGSQFEINRGDLKQVFTKKQFYRSTKGLPERLNAMTFDKYKLKKWEDFKENLKDIKLDKTINQKNVDDFFKPIGKTQIMGFEDYLGRKLVLSKKTFNKHKKRAQLFPFIKTILKQPDEVWLTKHNKKGFQTNYIKHYKNMSIFMSTTLNESMEGIEIETWFDLDYTKNLNRRAGLLIKKGSNL